MFQFKNIFKIKRDSFFKAVIILESILIIFFILLLSGLFQDEELSSSKTSEGNEPLSSDQLEQISESDLYQELTQDRTIENDQEYHDDLAEIDELEAEDLGDIKRMEEEIAPESDLDLAVYFDQDPYLNLVRFTSEPFSRSVTKSYLDTSRSTRVYTLVEFKKAIDLDVLNQMRDLKVYKIFQLTMSDYLNQRRAFFYLPYYRLKLLAKQKWIENIYILKDYSALGYYQLGIKSDRSVEKIKFDLYYPYSKPGHEILEIENKFSFTPFNQISKREGEDFLSLGYLEKNFLTFKTDLEAEEKIYFLSKIRSKISLNEMLENNIRIAGRKISLNDYRGQVERQDPALYQKYTQFTKKIVSSDYIKDLIRQLQVQKKSSQKGRSLAGLWKKLTFILDRDIRYDWNKRKLFFSGNLPFNNIRDMYKSARELSETKVGACTERTSLEITVLRELGIAARTATRLYHIFTEIYLPDQGWVSTSSTLNEIPLCHSTDEKMAYFAKWSPNHPIRLKWSGFLLPEIVTKSALKKVALNKLIR